MLNDGFREWDDEALMLRFRKEPDTAVFRALAERYVQRASYTARGMLGGLADPEDAVQETLLRIVRNRRRYKPGEPFAPWFFTVLRNVCIDMQRKALRRLEHLRRFTEMPDTRAASPSALERAREIMASIAPGDRHLLRLRYFHGFSFAEIAARLECSVEAAKKRHQRLIRGLR